MPSLCNYGMTWTCRRADDYQIEKKIFWFVVFKDGMDAIYIGGIHFLSAINK